MVKPAATQQLGAPENTRHVHPEAEWSKLLSRLRAAVPEAFDANGNVLNLLEGRWSHPGHGKHYASPIDGSELGRMPMIDPETAKHAVRFGANEFLAWLKFDLDERRRCVAAALDGLREHADLLAYLSPRLRPTADCTR